MQTISKEHVVDRLRSFLQESFPNAASADLAEDASLLESGIVDSMGVLEILNFLSAEFGVAADDLILSMDNFATLSAIASMVLTCLEQGQQ